MDILKRKWRKFYKSVPAAYIDWKKALFPDASQPKPYISYVSIFKYQQIAY